MNINFILLLIILLKNKKDVYTHFNLVHYSCVFLTFLSTTGRKTTPIFFQTQKVYLL